MCAEVPASSMILLLGTIWSTWEVKIFANLRSRSVVFHCVTSCFPHIPLAFSLIRSSRFGRNLSLSKLPGSMVSSVCISTLAGGTCIDLPPCRFYKSVNTPNGTEGQTASAIDRYDSSEPWAPSAPGRVVPYSPMLSCLLSPRLQRQESQWLRNCPVNSISISSY